MIPTLLRRSLTIVIATFALATTACSRAGSDDAFHWAQQLPAGAVLHLLDGSGAITVRRAPDASVAVAGSRQWRRGRASDVSFTVTQSGSDYYVCAMWRGSGRCDARGYRGAQTWSWRTMFAIVGRRTDTRADFVVQVPANVKVDARTVSGTVDVDGTLSGVYAKSVNGDVRASHVSGPIVLLATNGNITFAADSLGAADSVRLDTKNGMVHAELPANLEGNFDLAAVNGSVNTNIPVHAADGHRYMNRVVGQVGTSQRVVRVRALNGNAQVVTRGIPDSH
jgi:hypothetical protein